VEVHALSKRGWSVSAIARHLEVDRKTVRSYLAGDRVAGVRRSSATDPLVPFAGCLKARFVDDPHLWATALFDEVVALVYGRSYPSFVRQVRVAGLRPHCEACSGVKGRKTIDLLAHPPGEEIQWKNWAERRRAPWGATAFVLLGTLSHSGRTRGVLAESMDQAHLVEAMDLVLRRLGGTARCWRTDRLATVIVPGTGDVQASFAPVAKYYGTSVVACPPRRGNRKGAVECGVKFMCGRWWRTMAEVTPEAAQATLDRFWSTVGDARLRPAGRYANAGTLPDGVAPGWPSVAELADAETLMGLPPCHSVTRRRPRCAAAPAGRGTPHRPGRGAGRVRRDRHRVQRHHGDLRHPRPGRRAPLHPNLHPRRATPHPSPRHDHPPLEPGLRPGSQSGPSRPQSRRTPRRSGQGGRPDRPAVRAVQPDRHPPPAAHRHRRRARPTRTAPRQPVAGTRGTVPRTNPSSR
jgi:hypothetical protein